jgi:hypothetical protein
MAEFLLDPPVRCVVDDLNRLEIEMEAVNNVLSGWVGRKVAQLPLDTPVSS